MAAGVAERAERLARRRSLAAILLGVAVAATQARRMDAGGAGPAAWIVTGLVVALFLLWASGLGRAAALRGILNDEGSDVARRRALTIGFCNMLVTALVCYALTFARDYGPRDAIQVILSVGMSSALISFGVGERIAAR